MVGELEQVLKFMLFGNESERPRLRFKLLKQILSG